MESKDNLNKIRFYYNNCAENSPTPTELNWFYTIEQDLDRLEKYDKAKELIKKKKVDVKLLLDDNDDRIRPEYRFFDYNCTRKYEEKLDQEEFDLLKEVFG